MTGPERPLPPPPRPARRRGLLVLGVSAAWLLIGVVMGAQASFGAALAGEPPTPLGDAIAGGLIQTVPWIPVSLAIVLLALRLPLSRSNWVRRAPLHLVAAALAVFAANTLVVLGYWMVSGAFQGLPVLFREGARWTVLRFHIGLMVYLAVVALTLMARYYRQTSDKELRLARLEGQLATARLQALNAQMRPHFLFNTLHTIGQLWRSGADEEAEAALDHLGSLFHKVQHSTQAFEVPLADELAMVGEYLAIETARFRDRLQFSVHADEEILEWMVPPLILQPLVENAIRHGISSRSTAGRVEVLAEAVGRQLRLTVRDDGPGMGATTAQPGSGIGLVNTRERLAQLHGAAGRLEIESGNGHGTTVTVWLPGPAAG